MFIRKVGAFLRTMFLAETITCKYRQTHLMKKSIKEFTKKDWDTLFPIKLSEHNPEWKNIFESEKQKINENVGIEFIERIEHFGSSSIPNIKSKPYIDILIEVPKELLFAPQMIKGFEDIGYTCLTEPIEDNDDNYMILAKGYNVDGTNEQVFHIHACSKGNPMLNQIEFRDYLISNPERAKEYETLKIKLESEFKNDRSGYRIAKTEFINKTLKMCKEKGYR